MHKFRSEVKWSCSVVSNSCDTMDYSLPGFSIHGISQSRILEWVAISFSRRSSWPRDWTWVSRIVGRRFTVWATREVHVQKRRLLFHKETHVNIFHFIWLEVFSICTRVWIWPSPPLYFAPCIFSPSLQSSLITGQNKNVPLLTSCEHLHLLFSQKWDQQGASMGCSPPQCYHHLSPIWLASIYLWSEEQWPQIHIHPEPQRVTLPGHKIFADVIR